MTEPMGERGRQGAAPLGGHTPGPWEIRGTPGLADAHIVSADGWIVVDPCGANPQDIRLIAAAPRMLEALENAHGILQVNLGDVDPHVRSACDLMWAAIQEANGGE